MRCRTGNTFNGTFIQIDGNLIPLAIVNQLRKIDLAHHGWHHMTVLQVEIVIGTIEIGRHHSDIVRAVLQIIALAHLQSRNLRNGIFLIGVF